MLKKHVGRRILLLMSELGMAVSQIAMGIYFYILNGIRTSETASYSDMDNVRWLPLPILIIFTGELTDELTHELTCQKLSPKCNIFGN